MGIRDINIPKMKFKKMNINTNMLEQFHELDLAEINNKNMKNRTTPYEDMTHYKTVKEFFLKSIKEYPERPCILEKPNHKEEYKTITYKQFGEDVLGLGTSLVNLLNLKDKRVIIIGETRNPVGMYHIWQCFVELELPFQQIRNYL